MEFNFKVQLFFSLKFSGKKLLTIAAFMLFVMNTKLLRLAMKWYVKISSFISKSM